MLRLSLLTLLASFSFIFVSCKHTPFEPLPSNNNNGGNNGPDTSLCFERDILPIFISNCAKGGCHDALKHEEGYVLDGYDNIISKGINKGSASSSKIYKVLVESDPEDRMPKDNPALTADQIEKIRRWINSGAPNTTGCASICDSNSFTFAASIKPLLDNNCKGCHNNSTPSGGFSYETYAGVTAAVQSGRFIGAIKQQAGYSPMPKGGTPLSGCQVKQIEKWIAAGMPNN